MPSDELQQYVDLWWRAVNDFTALLEEVPADSWSAPTDLPGWDVHAVAAHTAHLERLQAGGEHDDSVEVGEAAHVRSPMGTFTEQGVRARRDHDPDDLINEIREAATRRRTILLEEPPVDPDALAPGLFGGLGWTMRTLLRNRPLDLWMHEQDIRRATDLPGNLDGETARHAARQLSQSLAFVLAKRVGSPAGTAVRLEVEGLEPVVARVGEDGRGRIEQALGDTDAAAVIRTDLESFLLLAGGRRAPADGRVTVDGDQELGRRVLEHLAVTP